MKIKELLREIVRQGASDVHLNLGSSPVIRMDGKITFLKDYTVLTHKDLEHAISVITTEEQRKIFSETKESDFAFVLPGVSRFRVNLYVERGNPAVSMRVIPSKIKHIDELNLPPILEKLSLKPRGLVLCTGAAGSGKSTAIAAMIEHINENSSQNIITIEDPIEFLFTNKRSLISQREVGIDTLSFMEALRHVFREDPNVIFLGEIRDIETMDIALKAADTGHLVFSTLHTANATETINRVISFYPLHQQQYLRVLLAATLIAVISLRLLPRADGKGRIPAVEIMIVTDRIKECILDPLKTAFIQNAIKEGSEYYGMQTFDQAIMDLYKKGLITYESAIGTVTSPEEFDMRLKGIEVSIESTQS